MKRFDEEKSKITFQCFHGFEDQDSVFAEYWMADICSLYNNANKRNKENKKEFIK